MWEGLEADTAVISEHIRHLALVTANLLRGGAPGTHAVRGGSMLFEKKSHILEGPGDGSVGHASHDCSGRSNGQARHVLLAHTMKVRELMRTPITIQDTDSLATATRAMHSWQIRHLPVLSDGRLVGLLSQRDVFRTRAYADRDDDWWMLRVRDGMTHPVQTCGPDDSLTEVAGRFAASQIGALPVVELGRVIGIVTVTDVLAAEVQRSMSGGPSPSLTAADVMTPLPQTIGIETPLLEAVARMIKNRVRHLPVVGPASDIVGVLSERDVRTRVGNPVDYAKGDRADLDRLKVGDVMSTPAITVKFDATLEEVTRVLTERRIGAVPVLDAFGAVVGIVSYVDALRGVRAPGIA